MSVDSNLTTDAPRPLVFDVARATEISILPPVPDFPPVSLREEREDFRVDEILSFKAEGEGEHLFLHIKKCGLTTTAVLDRLSRTYGIRPMDIGFAGRKDARGVTTQWMSAPRKFIDDEGARIKEEGVLDVLAAIPHRKKLHLGTLQANVFSVVIKPVDDAVLDVDAIRARALVVARGFPNAFGLQRFGADGRSLDDALRFLARPRKARSRKERFLVSVAQSAWFNGWLKDRIDDGLLFAAVDGDVLGLKERGSTFICDDPAADTVRIANGDIEPRGPLYGPDMQPAERDAMTRESRSRSRDSTDGTDVARHPAFDKGARRPAIARAHDVVVAGGDGTVSLTFTLPKGSYATVFLRQVFGAGLRDHAFADAGSD